MQSNMKRLSQLFSLVFVVVMLVGGGVLAQESTTCEAGFRLFEHALGTSCIPENPQRVVVLDTGELDNALALGAPIVGAPITDVSRYQEYLINQFDGIADTGKVSEPNFEVILSLSPDLILGSKQRYEAIYDQLSEIAPTVLTASLRVPWQENFLVHADALGKNAEAEQWLAEYDAHIADVQAILGDALETTTISVIRFRPGQVRLYLKSSYIGYILQDVGLARPESQDQDVFSAEISLEELQQVDADYVFVTGYDVEDSERDVFLNSPLWSTLSAVQNDRVIDVDDGTWVAGLGVQAANAVLKDLADLFTPTDQFPITIEHQFGTTTIPAAPKRIVSIGYTEHDALLALGVVPVAVRYWYGDAIQPWAIDKLKGAEPVVLDMAFGNLNYEAILALQPDLISAVTAGITQEEYEALSEIAPTLTQSAGYINFGIPWQETTRLIGEAVGKSQLAARLINRVDGLFATARAENPEFAGKTISVTYNYGEAGTYGFYTDQDARGRFFTDLGFVIPDEFMQIAGDAFYADLSAERVDLLNQDVVIFLGLQFAPNGKEGILADPLFSQLPVTLNGNVGFVPPEYDGALQFSSILSLEYALEGVLPVLQALFAEDE